MNQSQISVSDMPQICVEALFLQYNVGNREALSRDLLYAMIDFLKQIIVDKENKSN